MHHVGMEISYRDRNSVLLQAFNIFICAVKLEILMWGYMEFDLLFEPPYTQVQDYW